MDVARDANVSFVHRNGAAGDFYYPELMQGGGGLVDIDGDGALDIYLVQSGSLPPRGDSAAENRLYRNRGDGSFEDWTERAGVADRGYGSGVTAADYDGDGLVDLYVTNLGRNTLYRNRGSGSFVDVTAATGVGDEGYSTCSIFFDFDGDQDLDLFVCNYLAWSPEVERRCVGPMGLEGYCSPGEYTAQQDTLYRNDGEAGFVDVTEASGLGGRPSTALGVGAADFDGDGLVDLYVANDQRPNFLWINRGDGTFTEEALSRGCALNELGQPEASMGVAVADPDADGDWDLFVVHLSGETNTFYRNRGDGSFADATDELGLGAVSQPYTGFGTGLVDLDLDGVLDLFIANGKVSPGDSVEFDYREPNQLLLGESEVGFRDVSGASGPAFTLLEVSRAAAFGDIDSDGDLDILLVNNAGPARLLRNDSPRRGAWLQVALQQAGSNRSGIGAVVTVRAAGRTWRRLVQPTMSYCASSDVRVHFGLGQIDSVERLEVLWPDGEASELEDIAIDQALVVER
ncbi:MAG: CRTAC1 family protein [Acidobacteriota bacterium]|nr:CRTAC1 family protein [Acidobacteriota bacterium]